MDIAYGAALLPAFTRVLTKIRACAVLHFPLSEATLTGTIGRREHLHEWVK
jgi:hypothetical protein